MSRVVPPPGGLVMCSVPPRASIRSRSPVSPDPRAGSAPPIGVKRRAALSPWLLLDLVRQPLWLAAIGAALAGFALQIVALRFGPLALVEPILVCDLIIAFLISAALRRRWDPVGIAGVIASAAGVAGFRSSPGHPVAGRR
jgi:hypothetical protein